MTRAQLQSAQENITRLQSELDALKRNGDGDGGFRVGQLQQEKQDMAVDYERQLLELKEELEVVTSERDDLKQNRERVNATLEGKIRRLEWQLEKSGPGQPPAKVS